MIVVRLNPSEAVPRANAIYRSVVATRDQPAVGARDQPTVGARR